MMKSANRGVLHFLISAAAAAMFAAAPVMAQTNAAAGADEAPEGGNIPITPGAGWTCTSDTPPEFFWNTPGEPVFANDGPFTFEGSLCVFVTDSFLTGDAFTVYDNDIPLGSTPMVVENEGGGCTDPQTNFDDPAYSSGVFPVPAGSHSITIEIINNPFDSGSGYIKVEECPSEIGGSATFLVSKDFSDNNEAEVEVTISCNTGLPLEQTTTISEGDPVNFVVGDFEAGTLECEVTEVVPGGYSVSYNDGTVSSENCSWEEVFGGANSCFITNSLDQVEVEVTKVWIDENPQFQAQNVADADWSCSNVASGQNNGFLQFFGNPGSDSFFVFPDWESGTTCSITEVALNESGVEVDDSDCQGLLVLPGEGASCTIFNTRLFEGIPTLSQYGLAVLALLMLGVGFIAFRRLI